MHLLFADSIYPAAVAGEDTSVARVVGGVAVDVAAVEDAVFLLLQQPPPASFVPASGS